MGYPTKAEWAAAKARALRVEADQLGRRQVPSSDWRGVQRKMRALSSIRAEALRFERMAERFREAA